MATINSVVARKGRRIVPYCKQCDKEKDAGSFYQRRNECKECISNLRKVMAINGLCFKCNGNEPSAPGYRLCFKHLEQDREWRKKVETQKRESGICDVHGCRKTAKEGRRCCEYHLTLALTKCKERGIARNDSGLCFKCGQNKVAASDQRFCVICYCANVSGCNKLHSSKSAGIRLIELFWSQGGICPLTGKTMRLGVDAELDHKIPRARGGSLNTSNVQWAIDWANRMKRDMLNEEFFERCRIIAERHPLCIDQPN